MNGLALNLSVPVPQPRPDGKGGGPSTVLKKMMMAWKWLPVEYKGQCEAGKCGEALTGVMMNPTSDVGVASEEGNLEAVPDARLMMMMLSTIGGTVMGKMTVIKMLVIKTGVETR